MNQIISATPTACAPFVRKVPPTACAAPLSNQTKGLKRNTMDKYYTKESTVNMCIDLVQKNLQINRNDLIIEPSAGNGSFIPGIKQLTDHYVFYDIEPEHADILPQDYLLLDGPAVEEGIEGRRIHVIGNPPFGRQSSLAIQFIKKSCEFCDSLSFILPKSFKKDSLQKTFPLSFHRVYETDIPNRSFLVNGQEHDVPCVFQIWEKRDASRAVCEKKVPRHFIFVSQNDGPDISFRRVGVNAGAIDVQTEGKSVQSHYFIRFTNGKSVDENRKKIADIKFEENNTVGPKSISKQELISRFNDCFDSI